MGNNQYFARYLTIAAYFKETPHDLRIMLESVRQLSFNVVNNIKIRLSIWTDDPKPSTKSCTLNKEWSVSYAESIRMLLVACQNPISEDSPLDFLWALKYDRCGITEEIRQAPFLTITFGASFLHKEQREKLDQSVESLLNAACVNGIAPYALIDVEDRRDTGYGLHYGSSRQGGLRFQREIEKQLWAVAGLKQFERVRGVFWGNLLGPTMVQRLGGAESLIDEFVHCVKGQDASWGPRLTSRFPDGSVLLKIWWRSKVSVNSSLV